MSFTVSDNTFQQQVDARYRLAERVGALTATLEIVFAALSGEHPSPDRAVKLLAEAIREQGGTPPANADGSYLTACVEACRLAPRSALKPYALLEALPEPEEEDAP